MKLKQKNNKKRGAIYFGLIILFGVLLTFTLAMFLFYNKYTDEKSGLNHFIGKRQAEVYQTYKEGENIMFALEKTAQYNSYKAAIDYGLSGGFANESPCGKFGGFNLWNNEEKECILNAAVDEFYPFMNDRLTESLDAIYAGFVPQDSFYYYMGEKSISGVSTKDMRLSFAGLLLKEYKVPQNKKEMIEKIAEEYLPLIKTSIDQSKKKYGVEISPSLVIAIIAQESRGDPYAISPTGCAGIMQFCYGTSKDYLDKAGFAGSFRTSYLTNCDCKGTVCKTNPKCHSGNDDRFDVKRSIQAGAYKLTNDIRRYAKYTDSEKFLIASYNAGAGIVNRAIELSGEDDPSFEIVAQYITPALIKIKYARLIKAGFFTTHQERVNKVNEIIGYVSKVTGYVKTAQDFVDSLSNTPKKTNSATGRVVQTNPDDSFEPPVLSGSYYLKPSFTIPNFLGLSRYPELYLGVLNAVKTCNQDEVCLRKELYALQQEGFDVLLNYDDVYLYENKKNDDAKELWIEACEPISEKPLNDFLAFYQSCDLSPDTNCLCETTASNLWNKEYDTYDAVDIHFVSQFTSSTPPQTNSQIIPQRYLISFNPEEENDQLKHVNTVLFKPLNYLQNNLLQYSLEENQIRLTLDQKNKESYYLSLYKKEAPPLSTSSMAFVSHDNQNIIHFDDGTSTQAELVSQCQSASYYKVCAVDKTIDLPIYDSKEEELLIKNPVIRFALYNKGTIPDPVQNVRVVDAFRAEGELFVAWDKLVDPFVTSYTIYYSNENLEILSLEDIQKKAKEQNSPIKEKNIPLADFENRPEKIVLNNLGSQTECTWLYGSARCDYTTKLLDAEGVETGETDVVSLEKGNSKGNSYAFTESPLIHLLDVSDGGPYYVLVVAKTRFGQESDQADVATKTNSIDDFPPPPCSNPKLTREGTPPNEYLLLSCTVSERREDIDQFLIEYEVIDESDMTRPVKRTFTPEFGLFHPYEVTHVLPKIQLQETSHEAVKEVRMRILTYQTQGTYQKAMYDSTYPKNDFLTLSKSDMSLVLGDGITTTP